MKVCFLAEIPSALGINGAHLGLIDGFERTVRLEPSDGLFCEIAPCGEFLPVRFCFDEQFLLAPPPQIRLYFTEDGVAVYACGFLRADQTMKVLWQERRNGTLLTLMLQGKLQLNMENETGFHMVELPDALSDCTAEEALGGYLLQSKEAFALLDRAGNILVLSEGTVLSKEDTLKAEVPFRDSLAHTALCEWQNGKLISCAVRTMREPTEATYALALFESALIGADCTPYLSEELAEKADSLKAYLGNYLSVVLTDDSEKVGLVYERKPRVYDVRYFRVQTENGKISNISPLE